MLDLVSAFPPHPRPLSWLAPSWSGSFPRSSPDLPNFSRPQPEESLLVLPHVPLPSFPFRMLSNFFFPSEIAYLKNENKHIALHSPGKIKWARMAERSNSAYFCKGLVTTSSPYTFRSGWFRKCNFGFLKSPSSLNVEWSTKALDIFWELSINILIVFLPTSFHWVSPLQPSLSSPFHLSFKLNIDTRTHVCVILFSIVQHCSTYLLLFKFELRGLFLPVSVSQASFPKHLIIPTSQFGFQTFFFFLTLLSSITVIFWRSIFYDFFSFYLFFLARRKVRYLREHMSKVMLDFQDIDVGITKAWRQSHPYIFKPLA